MPTPPRVFGPATQAQISRLRRMSITGLADATSPANDREVSMTVDVLRRAQTAAGSSALGIAPAFTTISGLNDIPALIRAGGTWRDQASGGERQLLEAERIVIVLDLPAGGAAARGELLASDRLRWSEPPYGKRTFEILEVQIREADQAAVALAKLVED